MFVFALLAFFMKESHRQNNKTKQFGDNGSTNFRYGKKLSKRHEGPAISHFLSCSAADSFTRIPNEQLYCNPVVP
ncbi:hypothetical protein NBRC111894_780 [Sporolactobacillus inulinus]|uniref:Uncharacterized protein n=1 Tax=Sporolactobacillus inulinus TaxID=2078 RepID=A0A4Y1Z8E1_9BACL|nr:hypothetical protein NBRC111894_780 [Sporolactobacillus inulinus]